MLGTKLAQAAVGLFTAGAVAIGAPMAFADAGSDTTSGTKPTSTSATQDKKTCAEREAARAKRLAERLAERAKRVAEQKARRTEAKKEMPHGFTVREDAWKKAQQHRKSCAEKMARKADRSNGSSTDTKDTTRGNGKHNGADKAAKARTQRNGS